MDSGDGPFHWYAIRTERHHEKPVHEHLRCCGIDSFLPLHRRSSRWKGHEKIVEWPVFTGMCFARLSDHRFDDVLSIPGVVGIVGSQGQPEPISEEEMITVKRLIETHASYAAVPYQDEGPLVEVARGPLQGLRGFYLRRDLQHYLIIPITLIRSAVAVTVAADPSFPQGSGFIPIATR